MYSFDLQEFLSLLEHYNIDIWPLQIIAYLLGLLVVLLLFWNSKASNKLILIILSFFWLWTGIVFCSIYWASINEFAYSYSFLFIIQGILFLYAVIGSKISMQFSTKFKSILGLIFIFYALIGYQILGHFMGHEYPKFFAFGMVPCPTTIFTIGLFLLAEKRIPIYLFIIPLFVAVSGIIAVYNGIFEDIGLILAGIAGFAYLFKKGSKSSIA